MRILAFGIVPRGGLWQYRGIVRLLCTQVVVVSIVFFLVSGVGTQMITCCEEIFAPPVIAHDAVDDAPARAHYLREQQNDCVKKRQNSILIALNLPAATISARVSRTTP